MTAHVADLLPDDLGPEPDDAEDDDAGEDGGEGVGEADNERHPERVVVRLGVAGEGYERAQRNAQ